MIAKEINRYGISLHTGNKETIEGVSPMSERKREHRTVPMLLLWAKSFVKESAFGLGTKCEGTVEVSLLPEMKD